MDYGKGIVLLKVLSLFDSLYCVLNIFQRKFHKIKLTSILFLTKSVSSSLG